MRFESRSRPGRNKTLNTNVRWGLTCSCAARANKCGDRRNDSAQHKDSAVSPKQPPNILSAECSTDSSDVRNQDSCQYGG
jgi:hypothetical protein